MSPIFGRNIMPSQKLHCAIMQHGVIKSLAAKLRTLQHLNLNRPIDFQWGIAVALKL